MKGLHRRSLFTTAFAEFFERAGGNETEVARRAGVARLTIRRWREGESTPNEASVHKLRTGLSWVDDGGQPRELTDEELGRLLTAAGHHAIAMLASPTEPDRAASTDRCTVYTHRYSRESFPSQWSTRVIDLEASIAGSIYTMWGVLPSITRSPEFYVGGYENGMYDREHVESYMAAHRVRQAAFLKRLQESEVHHLYSMTGVRAFLSGASAISTPLWEWWETPNQVIRQQFENVLTWLDNCPNFEVRLRPTVPGNVTIIGLNTVLVEFTHTARTRTSDNVTGLEIVGPDATVQFTKQFRSFWADEETIKDRDKVIRELRRLQREYLHRPGEGSRRTSRGKAVTTRKQHRSLEETGHGA
jgi:hypothetical protein